MQPGRNTIKKDHSPQNMMHIIVEEEGHNINETINKIEMP
jgi:hypothetical protein